VLLQRGLERPAALQEAAQTVLVGRIGGLAAQWRDIAARWDAASRREALNAEQQRRAEAVPGQESWYQLHEVRMTVDRIASVVTTDSLLILDADPVQCADGLPDSDSAPPGVYCHVRARLKVADAVEAFAIAVALAAHERGHQRWSGPCPRFVPEGEVSPADRAHGERRQRLFHLLEDVRIEALLDRVLPKVLGPYRRRAAAVRLREKFYTGGAPATEAWVAGLIEEQMLAATAGGVAPDDGPCVLRDEVPPALAWPADQVLRVGQRAAALGHEQGPVLGLATELESILDGEEE
jgi:hypothetical protein